MALYLALQMPVSSAILSAPGKHLPSLPHRSTSASYVTLAPLLTSWPRAPCAGYPVGSTDSMASTSCRIGHHRDSKRELHSPGSQSDAVYPFALAETVRIRNHIRVFWIPTKIAQSGFDTASSLPRLFGPMLPGFASRFDIPHDSTCRRALLHRVMPSAGDLPAKVSNLMEAN